jgi:phosphotransferase system HPr (HPr) family protein
VLQRLGHDPLRKFESEVTVSSGGQAANVKSVLDLLILAASRGDWLDVEARGADAEAAVEALWELAASWGSDPARPLVQGQPAADLGPQVVVAAAGDAKPGLPPGGIRSDRGLELLADLSPALQRHSSHPPS